ncbi:flagellar biosynthesis repressor FlbT [Novosphingobium sp. RD2P27]|uniref:Flagellar biosynthesis repressor FlbT n=1 Tax=Novosphingobium kalidii TaxID=3230299 RepID=A0ABV2D117_9SPHN
MALRIDLRDGESVVVNGAVLCASGRARILVQNRVTILRGTEIMLPEQATTPARRLYFACMMAYLEPEVEAYRDDVLSLYEAIFDTFVGEEAKLSCGKLATFMATGDFFRALGVCRELIEYEDGILERMESAGAQAAA